MRRRKNATFSLDELLIVSISLATITGLVVGFFIPRFSETNDVVNTMKKIEKEYYGKIDKNELSDAAINGMMNYLNEKHSTYMDDEDVQELNSKLDSSYEGIGVVIYTSDKGVTIYSVYEDTPAAKAGLKAGDIIVKVDDKKITKESDLYETKALIAAKKNTNITVKRGKKELTFKVDVKTLEAPVAIKKEFKSGNKRIGYIYLQSFAVQSYSQVKKLLEALEKEKLDGLIFDVRSNTGGYLDSCKDILALFEHKGSVLFSIEGKKEVVKYYDENDEERTYPMVVLIDSRTASSAEALAISLKENYGAILVGNTSYGKGTVQKTSSLSDDTMIKYTYAKWYSPLGNSIDGKGITPGVEVNLTMKYALNPTDNNDDQLKKAIDILSKN